MKLWTNTNSGFQIQLYNHPNRIGVSGLAESWGIFAACWKSIDLNNAFPLGIEVQQKAVGSCEKPWGPTTVAGFGWISLCLTSWGIPRYAFSSVSREWNFAGLWKRSCVECSTSLCMDQRCKNLVCFLSQLWKSPASMLQWWARHRSNRFKCFDWPFESRRAV